MSRRILAFVVTLILATLSACAARTDAAGGSEQHASSASALGVGPSSTPYPIKLVNGNPVAHWDGTLVDLMAADAWAQCGARVRSITAGQPGVLSAELSTDGYLAHLEEMIDKATCPDTFSQTPPSTEFEIVGCTPTACPSKMKRWARQRQLESCNVDASTGAAAVVAFHKNNEIGHYLASSLPASASPEFSGLLKPGVSSTILNQAVAAAQTEVDVAEVNLCMAQRLREHMASADSLFLSAADLRQLLEVIRERSQIAMMQYALLARTFTNPDNRSGGPSDPMQAFVTLMHWSTLSWAPLSDMGQDLAAAVQLHVDATRELAQLLVRSASARIDRAGAPTNNPQADFGSGSWRQRLLALLYGGNPLRAATTPGEIDPAGKSSEQVWAAIEAAESSVPWETAWTEDPDKNWGFPNVFPAFVPAQRYGRTPTSDPRVKQLLALARKADALYLKELNGDLAHIGLYGSTGTLTFRRIDVEKTAPQVWALVEAWLRTEECKKVNPSCTVGVNDPAMPAEEAYAASLLWRRYGIQPAHAASLVSMLADVLPLLSEGEGQKWFQPSEPSVAYEQVGAMHVTGASHTLTPAQLAARLPGRDADEVWYRLAPDFNVVPFGNAERALILTRFGGQSDYAAVAAKCIFNSNSIGLT